VVTRDDVRDRLWPGGKVEFDQGIAFAVREVRAAIQAAGGDPALLQTIPKRGFRLKAVSGAGAALPVPGLAAWTPVPTATDVGAPPEGAGAHSGRTHALGRRLGVITAVGAAVALALWLRRPEAPANSLPAVVVFTHDTEVSTNAALARALGSELTTELTRALAGRLGVIGPTGTSTLSGPDDTEGARASFGACLVVSGGIRGVGVDSVVVFTQIVRTGDRVHVWAALDTVAARGAAALVVPGVVEGVEGAIAAC
jgi:TolB-like protein